MFLDSKVPLSSLPHSRAVIILRPFSLLGPWFFFQRIRERGNAVDAVWLAEYPRFWEDDGNVLQGGTPPELGCIMCISFPRFPASLSRVVEGSPATGQDALRT